MSHKEVWRMYKWETDFTLISTAQQILDRIGSEEMTYRNWANTLGLHYGQQMDIEKERFFLIKNKSFHL